MLQLLLLLLMMMMMMNMLMMLTTACLASSCWWVVRHAGNMKELTPAWVKYRWPGYLYSLTPVTDCTPSNAPQFGRSIPVFSIPATQRRARRHSTTCVNDLSWPQPHVFRRFRSLGWYFRGLAVYRTGPTGPRVLRPIPVPFTMVNSNHAAWRALMNDECAGEPAS